MIKLVAILVLLTLGCRWAFGRWPWEYLDTRPRSLDHARARRLLGVRANASPDQIREAHRKMAAQLHPDRGGSDAKLAEINTARDLLLAELPSKDADENP